MQQQCVLVFVLISCLLNVASPNPFNPNDNQQGGVNAEPAFRFFGAPSTVTITSTVTQLQTLLAAKTCAVYLPGLAPCPAALVPGPQAAVGAPQLAQMMAKPGEGIDTGPLLRPGVPAVAKPGFPNFLPGLPNLNLFPQFPNFPNLFDADNPQVRASRALEDASADLGAGIDATGERKERRVLTLQLSPTAKLIVETTEPPESAFSGRTDFQIFNAIEPSMDSRSGGALEEFEIIGLPANCFAQQRNLLPGQLGIVKIVTTTSTVTSLTTSYFPGGVDPKATATFIVAGCIPVNPPLNFPRCLLNFAP